MSRVSIYNFLLPSVVGIAVYILVDQLFPTPNKLKTERKGFKKDPMADRRSVDKLKR